MLTNLAIHTLLSITPGPGGPVSWQGADLHGNCSAGRGGRPPGGRCCGATSVCSSSWWRTGSPGSCSSPRRGRRRHEPPGGTSVQRCSYSRCTAAQPWAAPCNMSIVQGWSVGVAEVGLLVVLPVVDPDVAAQFLPALPGAVVALAAVEEGVEEGLGLEEQQLGRVELQVLLLPARQAARVRDKLG